MSGVIFGETPVKNGGDILSDVELGDGNNRFDTRKGYVSGLVNMLAGNDTYLGGKRTDKVNGGDGNDKISGFNGSDILMGGLGNDRIDGGSGNDKLFGEDGNDVLKGGAGKDTFFFNGTPVVENADIIRDFKSKDDTFKLSQAVFTGLTKGKLSSDAFYKGAVAADAEDRIIYHKATGSLYYDPDGNGAQEQIRIATLSNKALLKVSDFIVY